MAEASPQPGRYFCHCCSVEIVPRLPVRSGREGGRAVRARRSRGELRPGGVRAAWRAGPRARGGGGGPPGGRGVGRTPWGSEAELRAGDGRRARGQDSGARRAASSAAPGLTAAPRGATSPTAQPGGLRQSHRNPTWLLQASYYCLSVALAGCALRAPPGSSPSLPLLPGYHLWVAVSQGPHQSFPKPPAASRLPWACVPRELCLGVLGPPASSSRWFWPGASQASYKPIGSD